MTAKKTKKKTDRKVNEDGSLDIGGHHIQHPLEPGMMVKVGVGDICFTGRLLGLNEEAVTLIESKATILGRTYLHGETYIPSTSILYVAVVNKDDKEVIRS